MPLPGVPVSPQTALIRDIMGDPLGIYDRCRGRMLMDRSAALKIDANFKALRVKAS
jgi:hypothetical protein